MNRTVGHWIKPVHSSLSQGLLWPRVRDLRAPARRAIPVRAAPWARAVLWARAAPWARAVLWARAALWARAVLWARAAPWARAVWPVRPVRYLSSSTMPYSLIATLEINDGTTDAASNLHQCAMIEFSRIPVKDLPLGGTSARQL